MPFYYTFLCFVLSKNSITSCLDKMYVNPVLPIKGTWHETLTFSSLFSNLLHNSYFFAPPNSLIEFILQTNKTEFISFLIGFSKVHLCTMKSVFTVQVLHISTKSYNIFCQDQVFSFYLMFIIDFPYSNLFVCLLSVVKKTFHLMN